MKGVVDIHWIQLADLGAYAHRTLHSPSTPWLSVIGGITMSNSRVEFVEVLELELELECSKFGGLQLFG